MACQQETTPIKLVLPDLGMEPMESEDESPKASTSKAAKKRKATRIDRDMQNDTHRMLYDLSALYDSTNIGSSDTDGSDYSKTVTVAKEDYSLSKINQLIYRTAESHKKNRGRTTDVTINKKTRRYKCTYCQFRSRRKYKVAAHEQTHVGQRVIKCKYCDFKGKTNREVYDHAKMHDADKPYKCKYCDYLAKFQCDLLTHEVSHNHGKSHHCHFCSYKSKLKSSVQAHERIHMKK